MKVKNVLLWFMIITMAAFLLAACGDDSSGDDNNGEGNQENSEDDNGDKLQVAASFSVVSDIAGEIGGDLVDVYNIVPIGTEPHEHDPSPDDTKEAQDADVFLYHGMNLEGGDSGWVSKLLDSVDKGDDEAFDLTEDVEPKYLGRIKDNEGEVNPHAFIDPQVGMKIAENTRDAFIEADPDHKDEYEENAEDYLDELDDIDQEYKDKIDDIPEDDRVFVASERAFQYMTERYGLKEGFIWEVDTEDNGTPDQIKNAVKFVEENEPPAMFVETNVDKRPMETLSNETGVEVYDDIYSDELGKEDTDGETYLKYLRSNIETIHDGLTQ